MSVSGKLGRGFAGNTCSSLTFEQAYSGLQGWGHSGDFNVHVNG